MIWRRFKQAIGSGLIGILVITGPAAWSAGRSTASDYRAHPSAISGKAHTGGRRVNLPLSGGGRARAQLPRQPLATTATIAPEVNLEVWQVARSGPTVTVVFALHDTDTTPGGSLDVSDEVNLQEALDLNASNPNASTAERVNNVANNVGLLDTSALKDYETFCNVTTGGTLTNCLASVDNVNLGSGGRQFMAAVVAAPPASTKTATLVTGVGSIPDVPISG